jgi:hypothetical protein
VTPEVESAVAELRETFAGNRLEVEDEAQGGAYVIVHDVAVGPRFRPESIWLGFLISFQYPAADVYPHFTDAALTRADGSPLGTGLSTSSWRERPAIQLSRRSSRWNAATDSAAGKLLKIIEWMRSL